MPLHIFVLPVIFRLIFLLAPSFHFYLDKTCIFFFPNGLLSSWKTLETLSCAAFSVTSLSNFCLVIWRIFHSPLLSWLLWLFTSWKAQIFFQLLVTADALYWWHSYTGTTREALVAYTRRKQAFNIFFFYVFAYTGTATASLLKARD